MKKGNRPRVDTDADAVTDGDQRSDDSSEQLALPEAGVAGVFPVVGIGASAGGLGAFEAFFSGMPAAPDPGMAFVLVQHLAPDHKSVLSELIRRYTRMQVSEVEDGVRVLPNCVYVIPPGRDLAYRDGTLQLLEPSAPRGHRLPIDFFFRSLAQGLRERAIGIVLSGTGSDGTLGVRAIKGEGGMVMVQTPSSTEYDGMPGSAIATGLVDYELAPEAMAAGLMRYASRAFRMPAHHAEAQPPSDENAFSKIFALLRAQTGHDFSLYKQNTVHRRIERRMALQQIDRLDRYLTYAERNPAEVRALFRDLLIGVTAFFRDPEAYAVVDSLAIPRMLADKPAGSTIRVWTPGCSTGEEAYSIAILLHEHVERSKKECKVLVFATDLDRQAIATARAGIYSASIAGDVTARRLERYFTAEGDGSMYRIHKSIRDIVVFSEQNVIKDPPFSKLDLITCRNLLIYMRGELQRRVIPLFHYALNPGGLLFLGNSEGVGDSEDLFTSLDRKAKLYLRQDDPHGRVPAGFGGFLPSFAPVDTAAPLLQRQGVQSTVSIRELTEQALLTHIASTAALVAASGDILYLHGRSGMYLEPAQGEAGVNNILKMAREGLRQELTVLLHRAAGTREIQHSPRLLVKTNGRHTPVDLTIRPVPAVPTGRMEEMWYLVILEEVPTAAPASDEETRTAALADAGGALLPGTPVDARIEILMRELLAKEELLHAAYKELGTANEERMTSNEEMQSVNEELQSTNEELETSKEELQSVNEELATVNTELHIKVTDLSRANNDMNNLLAGTGIGTVFVDYHLRILRFTPAATRIINLIPGDVGRPVNHIVANLVGYDSLAADVQAVLDTLRPLRVDVQTRDGSWYAMRILPYRTLDNVIEGAVLTFVDVTESKAAAEELRKANDLARLAVVVRDATDAITVHGLDGRILAWNPGAQRLYGWTEAEALAMNIRSMIPRDRVHQELQTLHRLMQANALESYETLRLGKDGSTRTVRVISTALVDENGETYAIATTERKVERHDDSTG
jgi:two-component system CheB/CheR fusion protein